MQRLAQLTLSLGFFLLAAIHPVSARAKDWSRTVAATPEGGFMMGNPKARTKLVEFVSMSCPHCANFDAEAHDKIINDYVRSGRLSYEIRNYVRDPFDMTAALIARCRGKKSFFPLTHRLLVTQSEWISKIQALAESQANELQAMEPQAQFKAIADWGGLYELAVAEGLKPGETNACLADVAAADRLVAMGRAATASYPELRGVPGFLINGALIEGSTWADLEPKLVAASQ